MARRLATSAGLLLLSRTLCALALDPSQLQVSTKKTISGVFMVTQNNEYSFNASVAFEVCKALHVNIATKAQVDTALQNGLEMCRFGWVEEKIAVTPRIQPNPRCGQGKTGLVPWRASESRLFDVFCFNNTDTVTSQRATTARTVTTERQEGSTSSRYPTVLPPFITSTLTRRPLLPTSAISRLPLSPPRRPPLSSKAPPEHLHNSTSSSKVTDNTLRTSTITTMTRRPSSSPHSISSTSSTSTSSTLSPPVHTAAPAQSHADRFGAAPTAILITLGLLLVLLAATAVYYKKKGGSLPFPKLGQEKGVVETEMFKHFRERDLKRHHSVGDGERSKKCSSDITLLMEQEAKAEIA